MRYIHGSEQFREDDLKKKGYSHGASYLENLSGRLFTNIEIWLKTGVTAPKTISLLDRVFREVGHRLTNSLGIGGQNGRQALQDDHAEAVLQGQMENDVGQAMYRVLTDFSRKNHFDQKRRFIHFPSINRLYECLFKRYLDCVHHCLISLFSFIFEPILKGIQAFDLRQDAF